MAYSKEIKEKAAIQYAINGSVTQTGRALDIPHNTISDWKKLDWWDAIIDTVRHEKQQEHIATYTKIVDEAQKVVLEKLPSATASQANIIAATASDKALLLQGRPTSISGRTDSLESLKDQFRKLSSTHTIVPNSTITDQKGPKDDKG